MFADKFFLKIPAFFLAGLFFFMDPCEAEIRASSDALVTASIAEPSNLIPFFASDTASAEISGLIFNGLVKYDKNIKLVGDLAESWEVHDGGLRIVFHLRKNVRWHDGTLFTAEDVEFTFKKLTDPEVPTPYGGDFEKVKTLTVLDPHTLEVLYKEPFSPGLSSWGMGIVPKHLLEKEDLRTTGFSKRPVGTGPYRFKKWKRGETIELEANSDYFEGKPRIERYVYRVIPDVSTQFLELQTENLDLVSLTPLQFVRETDSRFFKEKYVKYRYPSFAYVYMGYNLEDPLFTDKRVRKAIGLAIPREDLIRVTLFGTGRAATGPFLPGTWAYNDAVPVPGRDLDRARALLREAGWADTDKDGLLDKDGAPFKFTILTNQGSDQRKMACEIIQKALADIGIEMKIQVVEWGTFLKEFIDKKRFEAVLLAWQMSRDPDIFDLFHSSKTAPGEFNFVSYRNEEVDRLLEEGRRIFGEAERAAVYQKIHAILADEEPYAFLYVPDALPMVHRRFRGVEEAPAGIGHNLIHWYVEPEEVRYDL